MNTRSQSIPIAVILLSVATVSTAQRVSYEVSFPNLAHHEAEISVTFDGAPSDRPLEVRMSRTSPGRYALHEFAKNVYNVRAVDGSGAELEITRPNPHQWDVSGHDGTVTVSYTLFGDRADGTYSGFSTRYAHMNMPATFMWARRMTDALVRIAFEVPDGWDVATQLYPTDEPGVYTAPDFAYFIDSPTHIGPLDWRTWEVSEDGATYTIRIAINHDGTDAELDQYTEMTREVVAEQIAMWGDIPNFETGTYTFIVVYLPYADGDGMEHRNSTVVVSSSPLSRSILDRIGTVSHEFFHAWNVERIRPATLEPFDFEEANMSRELWFAEGFTSYYDDLFIRRAGLIDDSEYADRISGTVNTVLNAPGRRFFSPIEMSMQAPFVDAATSVDPQNKRNTFISYYTWGAGIGLVLDLTLRSRFGSSLDDLMRAMWTEYGVPERAYVVEDIERKLAELTGDEAFAAGFFDGYIRGHEAPDYETLLAEAGFAVRLRNPNSVWLGADVAAGFVVPSAARDPSTPETSRIQDSDEAGVMIDEEPLIASPLYEAGIARRDRILKVDGRDVTGSGFLDGVLSVSSPGDTLEVTYVKRGVEGTVDVILTHDPTVEVVTFEELNHEVSAEAQARRSGWLRSRAG